MMIVSFPATFAHTLIGRAWNNALNPLKIRRKLLAAWMFTRFACYLRHRFALALSLNFIATSSRFQLQQFQLCIR
jgi:hypothetical protein